MAETPDPAIQSQSSSTFISEDAIMQPKLADVKFPDTPDEQREQPKSLKLKKKANTERQNRRDRESQGDTARQSGSVFR